MPATTKLPAIGTEPILVSRSDKERVRGVVESLLGSQNGVIQLDMGVTLVLEDGFLTVEINGQEQSGADNDNILKNLSDTYIKEKGTVIDLDTYRSPRTPIVAVQAIVNEIRGVTPQGLPVVGSRVEVERPVAAQANAGSPQRTQLFRALSPTDLSGDEDGSRTTQQIPAVDGGNQTLLGIRPLSRTNKPKRLAEPFVEGLSGKELIDAIEAMPSQSGGGSEVHIDPLAAAKQAGVSTEFLFVPEPVNKKRNLFLVLSTLPGNLLRKLVDLFRS